MNLQLFHIQVEPPLTTKIFEAQIKSLAHCTHYQMTSFLWKACNILSTFKTSDEHQKVNRVKTQCYAA